MLSIYENDSILKSSRPPGANSVETKLLICVFTRDYQYERKSKSNLDYMSYILARFVTMIKPKDVKTFENLIKMEIEHAKELYLVTESGELTARGIVFIDGSLNGSYLYNFPKFDSIMAIYMTVMTMPEFESLAPEFCQCEDCEKGAKEYIPMDSVKEKDEPLPDTMRVDIPMEDFIALVDKYKPKSFTKKIKRLLKG